MCALACGHQPTHEKSASVTAPSGATTQSRLGGRVAELVAPSGAATQSRLGGRVPELVACTRQAAHLLELADAALAAAARGWAAGIHHDVGTGPQHSGAPLLEGLTVAMRVHAAPPRLAAESAGRSVGGLRPGQLPARCTASEQRWLTSSGRCLDHRLSEQGRQQADAPDGEHGSHG